MIGKSAASTVEMILSVVDTVAVTIPFNHIHLNIAISHRSKRTLVNLLCRLENLISEFTRNPDQITTSVWA